MGQLINIETLRLFASVIVSSLLAAITPAGGFLVALTVAFGFNIWCGMRADGVVILTCKNWSNKKFMDSVRMLLLYATIIVGFSIICYYMGDQEYGQYAVKILTWVFILAYIQNSFKNLVIAYPKSEALMFIYLLIRLEWKKMTSGQVSKKLQEFAERQEKMKNL